MAIFYETKQEIISGTDLSGLDGASNRTYALANPGAIAAGMAVSVDGTWLQYGYHYTVSVDTITFLTPMYDTSVIVISYQVGSASTVAGTYYTTPALVQAELRVDTTFGSTTVPSLDTVNNWIDEESRYIDTITNSVYSTTTVSSTYVDYDGEGRLRFPNAPLISITKVEYNINSIGMASSWIELEEGFDKDYISYLDLGEIEFVKGINSTNKVFPISGVKKFRLSYLHGIALVPADIQKLATLLVAKRTLLSLANSQANTEGGSIQIGTIQITDPTTYGINYINTLTAEIKDYTATIGRGFKTYRPTRVYQ